MKKWKLWPKNVITQIFQRPYILISILVRRQYIKLVKQHHPDTAANDGNLQYFQKIDRAYRELMQKFAEDKRKEEKCIGEYGLYYDESSTDEKNTKYEHPDIQHTAPQHR